MIWDTDSAHKLEVLKRDAAAVNSSYGAFSISYSSTGQYLVSTGVSHHGWPKRRDDWVIVWELAEKNDE